MTQKGIPGRALKFTVTLTNQALRVEYPELHLQQILQLLEPVPIRFKKTNDMMTPSILIPIRFSLEDHSKSIDGFADTNPNLLLQKDKKTREIREIPEFKLATTMI